MEEKNEKKKQKPPSRIRYENNHPVISFRSSSREMYNEFMAHLYENNLSIGAFFRIALKKQKENFEQATNESYTEGFNAGRALGDTEGYDRGYNTGYTKGKDDGIIKGRSEGFNDAYKKYCIVYYCAICNQPDIILPNSYLHLAIIDFLRYKGWKHDICPQQYIRYY